MTEAKGEQASPAVQTGAGRKRHDPIWTHDFIDATAYGLNPQLLMGSSLRASTVIAMMFPRTFLLTLCWGFEEPARRTEKP